MSVRIKAAICLKKKLLLTKNEYNFSRNIEDILETNIYFRTIDNFWKLIGQIEIKFQFHFKLWIQKKGFKTSEFGMWILLIEEKEFVGKLMSFQYFLEKKLHFLLFF